MERPQKNWQMTDYERGLILKVADGHEFCLRLIFNMKNHYPRCNQILEYLLRNKLTGERLYIWVKNEMGNSPLRAWKYCLSKIAGERDFKVILGKDFV